MQSFEAAARSENKQAVMRLFHPSALIWGTHKNGPLDRVMSKNFKFEIDASKMLPHSPCVLVATPWTAVSEIDGGPTYSGDATFFLGAEMDEKGNRFVAYHAHLSLEK